MRIFASFIKPRSNCIAQFSAYNGTNMKLLILSVCVACVCADVSHVVGKDESKAQILKQELDVSPEGSYQWAFETDNGIASAARGEITNPNAENSAQVSQGEASWTSPEGEKISIQYVADENGYQPQGSHIPTPPPIPEAILRALEYIRTHPPAPEKK